MRPGHAVQGSARRAGATNGPDWYPSEGAGVPNALRANQTVRKRVRRGQVIDTILGTLTGAAMGFGLAIIAVGIYVKDLWP